MEEQSQEPVQPPTPEGVGEKQVEEMRRLRSAPGKESDFLKKALSLLWVKRKILIVAALVACIALFSFYVRSIPAKYNDVQELDTMYLYRMAQYVLDHNFQLPELDLYRHHPFGSVPIQDEFPGHIYTSTLLYSLFRPDMPFYRFTILYPAVIGALMAIVMFFIGRELLNEKAGLFASFFLATVPASIIRTSSGFFDKETTFGLFMLLSVAFFLASYKRGSWKLGLLAGAFLGLAGLTAGLARYTFIFFSLFALIMLLLNRHKQLLPSYAPMVLASITVQLISPKNNLNSVFFFLLVGLLAILLIREALGRYKLLQEKDLKYVVPALVVITLVGVLLASVFVEEVSLLAGNVISTAFVLNPNPVGYTVAEQQPGSWESMAGSADLRFSQAALPQLSLLIPAASIWVLSLLGILLVLYRLVRRRDLLLLLPLVWVIAGMWGVFLFIRLIFLFGPPAVALAGLFAGWGVTVLLNLRHHKSEKIKSAARYMPFYVTILVALVVALNAANALAYASQIGPSVCITDPRILINGEKCLDVDRDGTFTYAQGQPWYDAMTFLRNLPPPKNVLTWWDFGHLFNLHGDTPSVSDGGKGPREDTALWYTASTGRWDEFVPWMRDTYKVTHIIQDYTLPGKYGAISAIATNGQGTVGFLQFNRGQTFPQGNITIQEFTGGDYAIWIPFLQDGNLASSPMLLVSQGGQYVQSGFINDLCTTQGILHAGDQSPSIGGCVSFSSFGVYYIPEVAKDTIFVSLQFMDGAGLPVEKVFDNNWIKTYQVRYEAGNQTSGEAAQEPA